MELSDSPTCARCSAPIPAGAMDHLCPACLMSGALHAPDDGSVLVPPDPSPSFTEPTAFPCPFDGYTLLGLLGRGGMGAVYEAEQVATGRRVALKMLGQQLDSAEMRERFLREGRFAAGVSHPNSLYVFGTEEIEGHPVITMEIADGGTLKDTLDQRGPLPVSEAVDAILDVIAGLEVAAAGGVLHRDVKPSNCFVSRDGSVKVGDFGLSVSTLSTDDTFATATGVVLGTPAYASPEQLRGDELDVRADIYSVGATLFTLLTAQAPVAGKNAVQVVANVVNQKPKPVGELRTGVPPGLERLVARCLAKEAEGRYADYMALRNALLPFSSRQPEPATMTARGSAGWIDYLIAFLMPYVPIGLFVGSEAVHIVPLVERTLSSASYYLACLAFGVLYFSLAEGIWGAGIGKRLKGLRVVGKNGRSAGVGRALIRILVPLFCVEGVRVPLLLASISATRVNDLTTPDIVLFFIATFGCACIPVVLARGARRENGFATVWDLASGTKVVVRATGTVRPSVTPTHGAEAAAAGAASLGPYQIIRALARGAWTVATDPVLRRQVWLLRRRASELPLARRNLGRSGRPRWLQTVETGDATWDAFEASQGVPFSSLVEHGERLPWGTLRHWLHDLASELWEATRDRTLPSELSLDHVWVTARGRAVLLDEPWPDVETPAERVSAGDLAAQQRFLHAIAACVESTSLPLHARPLLQNLENGRFEKLSFLTGILRGLLDRPADVSRGIRAGAIFMLPLYVWIMLFIGTYQGAAWPNDIVGDSAASLAVTTTMLVLVASALSQLLVLPFRTTTGHATFRLAVVNAKGQSAGASQLLARWGIVWLPLFLPMSIVLLLIDRAELVAWFSAFVLLLLWLGTAVYAVTHPNRGLHDRLAGTWVVRR